MCDTKSKMLANELRIAIASCRQMFEIGKSTKLGGGGGGGGEVQVLFSSNM